MEPEPTVLDSLRRAVDAMPDDVPLRLHLATMLLRGGQRDEAVRQLGAVLQRDPGNAQALGLLRGQASEEGLGVTGFDPAPEPAEAEGQPPAAPADPPDPSPERAVALPPSPGPVESPGEARGLGQPPQYDWSQAEDELRDVLPAMFIGEGDPADLASAGIDEADAYDAEHAGLTLADVAGMTEVKQRLEAAFLAPMRNPELRRLYGKSLRGGLLLYGPPGCGKTFIARAVAGELGARFIAVSFADIIDMFVGQSERNIHELFEIARRNAPCVLFLDEVDAIGQKRSQLRHTPMRSAVNQLLLELDDISGHNEGVFLLAATNHPWDVDSALRRPGRFDRTLLVLPPDAAAREGVFRYHLKDRPVAGIDLAKLARQTDGYSGADIAHICETAAERALMDSVSRGEPRMIGTPDLEAAIAEVKPSLAAWFDVARNVALFANEGGTYDDLAAYLRKRRLL
jgi:AAA+ superfamily predicted ATPase